MGIAKEGEKSVNNDYFAKIWMLFCIRISHLVRFINEMILTMVVVPIRVETKNKFILLVNVTGDS